MRKITTCDKDCAAPHRTDAPVKPIRHVIYKYLRPNRAANQPTGAVMIAAAVM